MTAIERRLKRLRRLKTELENVGLEYAAQEVEDEIRSLTMLPSAADNPAVAEFLGAAMELEKGINEAESRGGRR